MVPSTGVRVAVEWVDLMEEAVNDSSIEVEHRALMGTVLQKRSVSVSKPADLG